VRAFLHSPKSLWLFLPIAFIPLWLPSGFPSEWYNLGRGWPWHYGLQATDVRPRPLPRIDSLGALLADLAVGIVVAVILWLLVRASFGRSKT